MNKLSLYWNTVRYLKPSQIYYRVRKMLKLDRPLGVEPRTLDGGVDFSPTSAVGELDLDPVFLARFPAEELAAGKVTFLHETEEFCWNERWEFPDRSPLWNYNLHYFEFLFPLVKAYKESRDERYLAVVKDSISGWIASNSKADKGPGWDPYPIALRLTNWLSCYAYVANYFWQDEAFENTFVKSVHEQYVFLSHHLEKDLLGNHYFEDLKALILCALFFDDGPVRQKALAEFHKQCREQILPDGMHFELSPMYHKIILEDVIRVAVALRGAGKADAEIEGYIQPMLDVAYSLEEGLERIPLFNDCGNNVAKSLDALCLAAKEHFGIEPHYKSQLPDSGYYIFKRDGWKLIVDAGQPGPKYIPGHAHCDAMSFELFRDGKPVVVNCGTYAYQCKERAFFRSTAAHNTVMVDGVEQSQCWGAFRMGRRSSTRVLEVDDHHIVMEMIDQAGNVIRRAIRMEETQLRVEDSSQGKKITGFIHGEMGRVYVFDADSSDGTASYAAEFGRAEMAPINVINGSDRLCYTIEFD